MKTRGIVVLIVGVVAVVLLAWIARRKPVEIPAAALPASRTALSAAQAQFGTNRELLRVNSADVSRVTIAGPGRTPLDLRAVGSGLFTMGGLATNEVVDAAVASRLAGAFEALSFIALADPARSAKDFGLEEPERLTIKTENGFYHSVLLGAPEGTNGRFARVRVEYQATVRPTEAEVRASLPAPTTAGLGDYEDRVQREVSRRMQEYETRIAGDAKKAREMDAEIKPWTYVLSFPAISNMITTRDQLVRTVEPPKKKPVENPVAPRPSTE